MDREELQAVQAPLKERYRSQPEAARVTLTADATLGAEGVSCSVSTGRALVEAGLHPATGGTGMLACSGDMLLEALAACAGVTLRAVATALGFAVGGTVHVEGDLDFGALWASRRTRASRSGSPLSASASISSTRSTATSSRRCCG